MILSVGGSSFFVRELYQDWYNVLNMSWVAIIVLLVFVFWIESKFKKVNQELHELRGLAHSFSLNIQSEMAISQSKIYGRMSGIKSAIQGKAFKKWPKSDIQKWRKFQKKHSSISKKTRIGLKYLSTEDAFYIQGVEGSSIIFKRGFGKTSIYSSEIIGDSTEIEYPSLRFEIRDRKIKKSDTTYHVLTGTLKEFKKIMKDGEFEILFNFPYAKNYGHGERYLKTKDYKLFGFKEKKNTPWFDKDDFGEHEPSFFDEITTYKNKQGTGILKFQ